METQDLRKLLAAERELRIQAEQAAEAAREESRATREMFQLALDSIPECIWWKDRRSQYVGCNRTFALVAGVEEPSQLVGKTDYELAWTREEADFYRQVDQQVMGEDRPVTRLLESLQRADGSSRVIETNKIPLHDATGEVIGILGTYEDVTERQLLQEELKQHRDHLEKLVEERTRKLAEEVQERQRAEESLAQRAAELDSANRALKAAEQAKNEFFASISHELRTPLTLILAPLESALSNPGERPLESTLRTVRSNALRLLDMVNSLLEFARLEARQVTVRRQPTDLRELLDRLVADFEPAVGARDQGLVLEFRLAEQVREMDPYLFERIAFNLLGNALKFTPEPGRVGIELAGDDETLELVVWDEGIGIAAADQGRLFQRFQQVESSSTRRYEGTGLGLAMVRDFARLLGGDATLTSEPGQGTRVCVKLPAPVAQGPAKPLGEPRRWTLRESSPRVATEPAPEDALEILVAEDNEELGNYLEELLAPTYRIRRARDGEEAWRMYCESQPGLVLSDIMMPVRDGLSLCRDIKSQPGGERIPVVLLTALSTRDSLLEGWEAGADEYLFKPFHPVELLTRVRSLVQAALHRQKAEDERRQLEARLHEAQKMEGLALMAGGVAHDFNNLLVVILGGLSLALSDLDSDALVVPDLEGALGATHQAAELTRQMLVYSGRAQSRSQPLDLAELVTDTARLAASGTARRTQLAIESHSAPVKGDQAQLRQIVMNLVINGIEATPEGRTPTLHVSCNCDSFSAEFLDGRLPEGVYSYIRVKDEGAGMDQATVDRMFDPFFSTKFQGRGLGLASVQGIVKAHGGTLRVFSEPGGGTTVWVVLPCDSGRMECSAPSGQDREKLVLVVDDDEAVRKTTARMVRKLGLETVEAADGREALDLCRRHGSSFKAILLDVVLPDLDGREVAKRIKAEAGDGCPPIILCSGYWGESPECDPALAFLLKPFDLSSLEDVLVRSR